MQDKIKINEKKQIKNFLQKEISPLGSVVKQGPSITPFLGLA